MSVEIARAFDKSGISQAAARGICKDFNRVWYAGSLHKHKTCGISDQVLSFILSFLSNMQLQMVLDGEP